MDNFLTMKTLIITGTILLLPVAFYGFLYLGAKQSRDCSQMIIDGYEIRSGIDIPEVKTINCYYDAEKNLRVSLFELQVPVGQFIGRSKLASTTGQQPLQSSSLLSTSELPSSGKLYARAGNRWGDQWRYVVDTESGRLWVEVLFHH